ncbi:LysR substrate-binding domain-containing protein [Aquabacterium sp.]|uniref:LysR substrate-binding domain-containing protein n=1 Tax=Aquabacterium sp. TaxID=1872578 RepID=UPI0039C8A19C
MRFDLTDLRLFLQVLDAGSMTLGSQRAHLALASASARIRGMEDATGLALFERHRSGVKPTKAGLAVAHHARLVLQQIDRLQQELQEHAGGLAGTVRLLCNTSAATEHLPPALGAFLCAHPALDVDLQELPSHRIVSRLLDGVGELGIVADTVDVSGLEALPFRRDQLVAIVPRGHALARRRRVGFAELLNHALVALDDDSALQQHLALQAMKLGRRLPARIRLRGFDAVCQLVAAGVGLGVVPAQVAARAAETLNLRVIALDESWADRQLLLCARSFATLAKPAAKLAATLLPQNAT